MQKSWIMDQSFHIIQALFYKHDQIESDLIITIWNNSYVIFHFGGKSKQVR